MSLLQDFATTKSNLESTLSQQANGWKTFAGDIQVEVDSMSAKVRRLQSDTQMEREESGRGLQSLQTFAQFSHQLLNKMADTMQRLVASSDLHLSLDRQEDIDRGEVALYGLRKQINQLVTHPPADQQAAQEGKLERERARSAKSRKGSPDARKDEYNAVKEPVMQLHKGCLSCSGQTSMIFELFKVACLAYAPGPISLECGRIVTRDQVQGRRDELVRECKALCVLMNDLQHGMN